VEMSTQPRERMVEQVRVTCSMQGEKVQILTSARGSREEGEARVRWGSASHGAGRSRKIADADGDVNSEAVEGEGTRNPSAHTSLCVI